MKTLDARTVIDSLNSDIDFDISHNNVPYFEMIVSEGKNLLQVFWQFGNGELALSLDVDYTTINDEDGATNDIDCIKSVQVLSYCAEDDLTPINIEGLNEHNLMNPIKKIFDFHNSVKKFDDDGYAINLVSEVYFNRGKNWIAIGGLK